MTQPLSIVVGLGPGLGFALVKKLVSAGHFVVQMARNQDSLDNLILEEDNHIRKNVQSVAVDASKADVLTAVIKGVVDDLDKHSRHLEALIWNVSYRRPSNFMDLTVKAMEVSLRINVVGAFAAIQACMPRMLQQQHGTVITTGATASVRGTAGFVNFTVGKAGARSMTHALARELGPQGIHFAHVIIDGPIASDWMKDMMEKNRQVYDSRKCLQPDAIANVFLHLINQDESCWTLELDVRPFCEKF
jgi:short-subunit dehydrogenase